jgi:UV DNA damage endonuclease
MIRVGYAAQNLTLPATTNRTLRLAGLADADKVRGLVRANLEALRTIIRWNAHHGVGLFRIGQSLIPFASHPQFPYDWQREHADELAEIGLLAQSLGIRLSMHPGQYIQPGSPNPTVVQNSLDELRFVAALFDLIGSGDATMVLHLGGAYGDYPQTAARFLSILANEPAILRFLALEGDERIWSVRQSLPTAAALGVPVIVDTLHHRMKPDGLTLAEVLDCALPTWNGRGVRPKVHVSSQDPAKQPGAHAYGIEQADWEELMTVLGDRDIDIMVEAKGKERALIGLGLISLCNEAPAIVRNQSHARP